MIDIKGLFLSQMLIILLTLLSMTVKAQTHFEMIVLGCGGGIDESNLSAYLISAPQEDKYLCLDAGSLMYGLQLAADAGHFRHLDSKKNELELPAHILHHHIDAYAISHPHLDHINGMLIAAPFDNKKTIYTSTKTANALLEHIFLSPLWGNFSDEGKDAIGKWHFERMHDEKWYPIINSSLQIHIFPLCHSCPNESSAFLIKNEEAYCLYFGDTGADEIEGENRLKNIYQEIKPLIQEKKLKALLIEVSFPNSQDNLKLYGHLKPILLEKELESLANVVNSGNPDTALNGLKVMITHLKPNFHKKNNNIAIIEKEVKKMKNYGAEIIILKQSEKYTF